MIVKRNLNPLKVVRYIKVELVIAISISVLVFSLHQYKILEVTIPFSVSAILGSALAIFIAFRNNSSYGRWWEARTLWSGIANNSRIFARQIIANADNAVAIGKASADIVNAYKREMIYRQIAFAHSLRLHLRGQANHEEFIPLISKEEATEVKTKQNIPNYLLLRQGIQVKEGMRAEILGAFDNISLEPVLAGLNNFQGSCERIKTTPLLRQYHYFTRVFLYAFVVTLPFALMGDFIKIKLPLLMIPISVLIAFVFSVIGKVGEVNEDPFENRMTDVPMTSICNDIEISLKEMLGEQMLPKRLEADHGYLN